MMGMMESKPKKRNVFFGTVMSVGVCVLTFLLLVAAVLGVAVLIAFMLRVLRGM